MFEASDEKIHHLSPWVAPLIRLDIALSSTPSSSSSSFSSSSTSSASSHHHHHRTLLICLESAGSGVRALIRTRTA